MTTIYAHIALLCAVLTLSAYISLSTIVTTSTKQNLLILSMIKSTKQNRLHCDPAPLDSFDYTFYLLHVALDAVHVIVHISYNVLQLVILVGLNGTLVCVTI